MPRAIVLSLLVAAMAAGALGAAALGANEGAMFRGGPAHPGVYPGRAIMGAPVLKWKFQTGGHVIASPAVVGGVAYVGATDGVFHAIDIKSGGLLWKFAAHARIVSSAAVADGVVYFGSYDRNFYALDAKTGVQKWAFKTGGERRFAAEHIHGTYPGAEKMPDPFDFYMSSPAVVSGAVYFGSGDGNVYALDAATGALRWAHQTGDVVHASPAVADGTVYVGSFDTYFYALDAGTGAVKWRFKTGEDPKIHNQEGIASSAAVADGMVYFGCRDSNLYALDAKSGREVWRVNNGGSWVIASPAVRRGVVYAATADTSKLFAVEARTGAALWTSEFQHWPFFSSPAVVGDVAYIGSHTGRLMAIDLKRHALAWAFDTDGSKANFARYANADGTTNYEAAQAENFYDALVVAVDRLMSVGAVLSSPVPVDGMVVFGSMDGGVYAVASGR